ncbi:MAG: RES family NAD+ phosphorylase [Tistlia sp.]|uniref:RES family NAD+ phosphorylase n=1 Tax=Tistlia sp. TaxID=3057121 RepID=UPI0034A519F4
MNPPPVSAFVGKGTVRLIPETAHQTPVLDPLADDDQEREALAEVEAVTSRRLMIERGDVAEVDPRELAFLARGRHLRRWGDTHVNASFAYSREGAGNRFNGPGRGAWYCALEDLTAIEEVAYHRTRELGYIGRYEDERLYQAILADFIGEFPDLRPAQGRPAALDPDPAAGYPAGQALAEQLQAEGHLGLLYPSVRAPGGTCFVAFAPQIVQNLRPGARWKLIWEGAPAFRVEQG